MNKKDIAEYIAENSTLTRSQSITATELFIEAIRNAIITREEIYIRGLASIKPVIRKNKKAQNIRKNTLIIVPPKKSVKFKLSKKITLSLNK